MAIQQTAQNQDLPGGAEKDRIGSVLGIPYPRDKRRALQDQVMQRIVDTIDLLAQTGQDVVLCGNSARPPILVSAGSGPNRSPGRAFIARAAVNQKRRNHL